MLLDIILATTILYLAIGAIMAALYMQTILNTVKVAPQDVQDSYNNLNTNFGSTVIKIFIFIFMTLIWPKAFISHFRS